jgi:hypothetical protein
MEDGKILDDRMINEPPAPGATHHNGPVP